jgi:uncharacterized protein (TIGR02996 family)
MRTAIVLAFVASVCLAGPADQARKLLESGKAQKAVDAARAAVAKNKNDVDAWLVFADALDATGEPEEAWTNLEKAIEANPKDGRLDVALGDIYRKLAAKEAAGSNDGTTIVNFYLDATRVYDEALAKQADLHAAHYGKAAAYYQLQKTAEARKALSECLKLKKDYGKAHSLQALMFYGERKYSEARDSYEIALKLDTSDPVDFVRLGHCYLRLKDNDKAKEWYIAVLKHHPNYSGSLLSGLYNLAGRDWGKTAPLLKEAVDAAPKSPAAWFYYGYALSQSEGKWDAALAAFQKASKLAPQDARNLYYVGLSYENLNDGKKALDNYRKALKVAPNYDLPAQRFQRIAAVYLSRDFAQLEKLMEELIVLAPDNGDYKNNYALWLRDWAEARGASKQANPPADVKKRIKRSSEVYEMAAKLLPDVAQLQSDTGLLFEYYPCIRDDKKAEGYFLRSLEVSDFTCRDAWSGMRRLCMRTKNYALLKECAEGVLGALEDSGKVPFAPGRGGNPAPDPNAKPRMIAQAKQAIAIAKKAGVKDEE